MTAPDVVSANVPRAHAEHLSEPARSEYLPRGHGWQRSTRIVHLDVSCVTNFPAAHDLQPACPFWFWYLPAGHTVQLVGGMAKPRNQPVKQRLQLAALVLMSWNMPALQAEQVSAVS